MTNARSGLKRFLMKRHRKRFCIAILPSVKRRTKPLVTVFFAGLKKSCRSWLTDWTKKRCLKKYDKVLVKIGRLKQKYSRVSGQYTISVIKDEKSDNAVNITWKQQARPETTDTHPGVYCLRTSQTGWDEATLWNTYTMLTDLEAVFRSLKSELGMRPVYHQIAQRVSGHLFITVLAYHLVHVIRVKLRQVGIISSWSSIRQILSPQCRVTVSMQCKNGNTVHVRKSTRPEPNQQLIFSALGVANIPGHQVKTTI